MAGKGELYRGKGDAWRWRLKAGNGEVVANGQAYTTKESARSTLQKVMAGQYDGDIVEVDG